MRLFRVHGLKNRATDRRKWVAIRLCLLLLLLFVLFCARDRVRRYGVALWYAAKTGQLPGKQTVSDILSKYGPAARSRFLRAFVQARVPYPPDHLALIGLKDTAHLEVWASSTGGANKLVRRYPILGLSGSLGPKMREGDLQVPEGIYRIESLHPNSRFHLALRINYPNEYDRRRAQAEKRHDIGSDIMIHGDSVSIGCLAMGDKAIEELFVMVADTGLENTLVVLSPIDFRTTDSSPSMPKTPETLELYTRIREELSNYRPAH